MDFSRRNQPSNARPVSKPASRQPASRPVVPAAQNVAPVVQSSLDIAWWKKRWILIGTVVALLAISLIAWGVLSEPKGQVVMSDRYQAVHLDNGQVFFGKLESIKGDFITLNDAYYTPTEPALKPSDKENQVDAAPLALIRVGDEGYGPERSVSIAKDQVLYWENLRADSKLVDAIKK